MNNNIILKPSVRYWLLSNSNYLLAIIIFCLCVYPFVLSYLIAKYFVGICVLILLLKMFWNFLVLLNVKFIIDDEQIILKKGIFNKSVDFVEMYRIYDYQKRQNILEFVFGIMNVFLSSRDITHPVIRLYGILNDDELIGKIRERVEKQKQLKHIYELNNSGSTM